MVRKLFLNQIFVLVFFIAILHISATIFHFYWSIWWFDLPVHFLGGVWMSLASLWLLFFSGYVHLRAKKPLDFIMTALLITLSFGILWELFEYLVGPDLT